MVARIEKAERILLKHKSKFERLQMKGKDGVPSQMAKTVVNLSSKLLSVAMELVFGEEFELCNISHRCFHKRHQLWGRNGTKRLSFSRGRGSMRRGLPIVGKNPRSNFTKQEREELNALWSDDITVVLKADKHNPRQQELSRKK